jgi:hypothetical protein
MGPYLLICCSLACVAQRPSRVSLPCAEDVTRFDLNVNDCVEVIGSDVDREKRPPAKCAAFHNRVSDQVARPGSREQKRGVPQQVMTEPMERRAWRKGAPVALPDMVEAASGVAGKMSSVCSEGEKEEQQKRVRWREEFSHERPPALRPGLAPPRPSVRRRDSITARLTPPSRLKPCLKTSSS